MKPNILVIMSDQHSKHVLGCYGNTIVRTPHLDRLALEGVRFTNAYCPSPLCVPSRMSFMTARRPSAIGVVNNNHILSPDIPTWAHQLSSVDYETVLIGRMHFVGPDQYHGFEKRPVGEISQRWATVPRIASHQYRESAEIVGKGKFEYEWLDEEVLKAACGFLEKKAGESGTRPFAAVAGFLLPHCPFVAAPDLFDYYYDKVDIPHFDENDLPPTIVRFLKLRKFLPGYLTEDQVRKARAAYFALVETFDRTVGTLLECLDRTGLAQNTLVFYCSDHGEMAGEKGCFFKSCYYEGSAGIPLIARLPGTIRPNTTSDAICSLMDIGPTLCELAKAPPIPGSDGISLMNILKGSIPDGWPDETFSELVHDSPTPEISSRMIRSGKWKLWVEHGMENLQPSLFDLETDLEENKDLGQDPAHSGIRDELMKKIYKDWDPAILADKADRAADEAMKVLDKRQEWEDKSLLHVAPESIDYGFKQC
jgi:choline-sulfatase